MIHLSQARSSIIFEHDGDSLAVLYWGKKLGAINEKSADGIRSALTKPAFHGGLDVFIDTGGQTHGRKINRHSSTGPAVSRPAIARKGALH